MRGDDARGGVRQLLVAEQDPLGRARGAAGAQENPGVTWGTFRKIYPERARGDRGSRTRYRHHSLYLGRGRSRVQRHGDPAGGDDRHQRGRVLERFGVPDRDPGAGRQPALVEAALPVSDGGAQAGVGERAAAAGLG